jgi:hypothetical protein
MRKVSEIFSDFGVSETPSFVFISQLTRIAIRNFGIPDKLQVGGIGILAVCVLQM